MRRNVAVPALQHSPAFGQFAPSQTVWSCKVPSVAFTFR
jgi:hypothetical protein